MTFYIVGRNGAQVVPIAEILKNLHGEEHKFIATNSVKCLDYKQEGDRDTFFIYLKISSTVAWDRVVTPKDENGRLINPKIDDLMQSTFVDDQVDFVNGRFEKYADFTIAEEEPLVSTANKIWEYVKDCITK